MGKEESGKLGYRWLSWEPMRLKASGTVVRARLEGAEEELAVELGSSNPCKQRKWDRTKKRASSSVSTESVGSVVYHEEFHWID